MKFTDLIMIICAVFMFAICVAQFELVYAIESLNNTIHSMSVDKNAKGIRVLHEDRHFRICVSDLETKELKCQD